MIVRLSYDRTPVPGDWLLERNLLPRLTVPPIPRPRKRSLHNGILQSIFRHSGFMPGYTFDHESAERRHVGEHLLALRRINTKPFITMSLRRKHRICTSLDFSSNAVPRPHATPLFAFRSSMSPVPATISRSQPAPTNLVNQTRIGLPHHWTCFVKS